MSELQDPVTTAIVHGKIIEATEPETGEVYQFAHVPLVSGGPGSGTWVGRNLEEEESHITNSERIEAIVSRARPDVRAIEKSESVFGDNGTPDDS